MSTGVVCTALTGEDGLEIRELPTRPLDAGEIRIAVRAASVNYPDVLMIRGQYHASAEPPFVAGTECAGEVVEVGREVTGFARGDRVLALTGTGAFATEAIARPGQAQVFRIPDSMPWAEATSLNVTYGTAYHGLIRRGGLVAGETVAITGAAGGCGSAAIQVAKAAGAAVVVAIAGGQAKCDLARRLGADVVIDHTETPGYSGAIRDTTRSFGVDVFFDPVGGADIREALRSLAWGGRYLMIGFAAGIPVVRLNQTIMKNISLVGVAYGMSAILDPKANEQDWAQLFRWYDQGKIRPAVGQVYPLARAADAMRAVYERRAVGKVVIEMPERAGG
jgi:NADPH2:quinone reductase